MIEGLEDCLGMAVSYNMTGFFARLLRKHG